MNAVHVPVMLEETLALLEPEQKDSLLIDCTMGEGGHSYGFLSRYPDLKVVGLDRDSGIQKRAKERLEEFSSRTAFYHTWFDDFFSCYPSELKRPDLILFDLGISVYHYELSGRGFTFRDKEPLDMRLDTSCGESAMDIVNGYPKEDLADLIYSFGEERYSRRIAEKIVEERSKFPIKFSNQLAEIIYNSVPGEYRHGRIHPATRTFQALRIKVNSELDRLRRALENAYRVLSPGGKMGVITFHSLEDRIVKNFFKDKCRVCICPENQVRCICGGRPGGVLLNKKVIEAGAQEVKDNPPSRSAKLRGIRKIYDREAV